MMLKHVTLIRCVECGMGCGLDCGMECLVLVVEWAASDRVVVHRVGRPSRLTSSSSPSQTPVTGSRRSSISCRRSITRK